MAAIENYSEFEEIPLYTSLQGIELVDWAKLGDTLKELLGVNLAPCANTNSMHFFKMVRHDGVDLCQECSPSSETSSKPIHHFSPDKNISTQKIESLR